MKRMTAAYSQCQSYEEAGTIHDVEVESGETNVSHVRFVRDRVFRLELHCERKHGIGPYSLVYYWDHGKWSEFNSINTHYQRNPVRQNTDEDSLIGGGY